MTTPPASSTDSPARSVALAYFRTGPDPVQPLPVRPAAVRRRPPGRDL